MVRLPEKTSVLRLKLLAFRLMKGSADAATVFSEWPEFSVNFNKAGWGPIAKWDGKSKDTFPFDAVYALMERVVYARDV